ncbi:MAG: hypothetical protein LBR80_01785 [Deltaproteobacteria bacterium]|nr:hypothetical protein [Deltaproteobacteria bacterium]
MDEFTGIVTPGFVFLLTRGRELGMATVAASRDFAGKAEADRKCAQQIAAKTSVKVFMRMAEAERTWDLLRRLAGDEAVMETTGFRLTPSGLTTDVWRDDFRAQPARRDLVHLIDLLEQTEGH